MVIMVEAGAVVAASAASTIENARFSLKTKKVRIKTRSEARSASKSVMTTTLRPFFLRMSNLKNCPVEKAMKASAMSGKNSVPSIIGLGTRLRQNGPIKIPATI